MRYSVKFDDQLCHGTIKIHNEAFDWMLSTEFESGELSTPQSLPEQCLGKIWRVAHFPSSTLHDETFHSFLSLSHV
jgi:hypothetical protein